MYEVLDLMRVELFRLKLAWMSRESVGFCLYTTPFEHFKSVAERQGPKPTKLR